jgi:hypothetical protein
MYLYRFDTISSLRAQRHHDPVLRGRRSSGNEKAFSHLQIKAAHSQAIDGEGVYRMSFWQSWDALRANSWAHAEGWVIQRICENHPILAGFERDEDEYLRGQAWLYWATLAVRVENPNWSSVGIPHSDIEVLHPNGSWMRMDDILELSNRVSPEWETVWYRWGDTRYPIHYARRTLPNGEEAVFLRQAMGPWPSHLDNEWKHSGLLQHLHNHVWNTDEQTPLRWFFALESDDWIEVEEIYPNIKQTRTPGLRGILDRFRGILPTEKWDVSITKETRRVRGQERSDLYSVFDASYVLFQDKDWSNQSIVPGFNELEALIQTFRQTTAD